MALWRCWEVRLRNPYVLAIPCGAHLTHPGVLREATYGLQHQTSVGPGVPSAAGTKYRAVTNRWGPVLARLDASATAGNH